MALPSAGDVGRVLEVEHDDDAGEVGRGGLGPVQRDARSLVDGAFAFARVALSLVGASGGVVSMIVDARRPCRSAPTLPAPSRAKKLYDQRPEADRGVDAVGRRRRAHRGAAVGGGRRRRAGRAADDVARRRPRAHRAAAGQASCTPPAARIGRGRRAAARRRRDVVDDLERGREHARPGRPRRARAPRSRARPRRRSRRCRSATGVDVEASSRPSR